MHATCCGQGFGRQAHPAGAHLGSGAAVGGAAALTGSEGLDHVQRLHVVMPCLGKKSQNQSELAGLAATRSGAGCNRGVSPPAGMQLAGRFESTGASHPLHTDIPAKHVATAVTLSTLTYLLNLWQLQS